VVFAGNVMRLGGVIVMAALMLLIFSLWRADRKRKARLAAREGLVAVKGARN